MTSTSEQASLDFKGLSSHLQSLCHHAIAIRETLEWHDRCEQLGYPPAHSTHTYSFPRIHKAFAHQKLATTWVQFLKPFKATDHRVYYVIAIREALQIIHKASTTKGMVDYVILISWNPSKIGMAIVNSWAYPPARSTNRISCPRIHKASATKTWVLCDCNSRSPSKYSQSLCHERHGMRCDCNLWNPPKIGMASANIRAYPPARSTHINQFFETPAVVRNTLPPCMCRPIHNYSQLKIRPAIDPVRRHRTLAPVRLQTNFNSGDSGQRD